MEEEKIVLTLGAEEPKAVIAEEAKPEVAPAKLDATSLTEEEQRMVDEFSQKIDITKSDTIMQHGSSAQKKIS
jgi:uncharacterized protein YaaN involved in tellurite resistance